MKTKTDVTIKFREYGEITIPKGTRTTNQTALGIDKIYNFVAEYGWIKSNYPTIEKVLKHDAIHYGINIPVEFLENE